MATYYKYAERDASNQVNWAEITSNMVNSLKEVEAIRESKRQAIDDATTELSRTLSEAPQGEHSGLNEFAMTYANNAQQMRLMQDQLLKSGQLKLKDYNIGRANLTEGTTQLFNLGKKYQAVYKEKMDRFKNGESGSQEQFQMAELETFANFSNHEAYINPTNGQVSVGKLINEDRDGKTVTTMDRTPGSFITVQELNFSVTQQVDKYKLDGLDADVDRLAKKYVKTFGPNFSIDDVRQLPEFKKMKQDMINAQMATGEQNVGSMLADYVKIAPNGKAYGYTRDPNKQDENTILLVADPNQPGSGKLVPDFSSEIGKKQYKEAEGFIGREIEKQLSRTETEKEPTPPRESRILARNKQKAQANSVELWNSMYGDNLTKAEIKRKAKSLLSDPYLRDEVGLRYIDIKDDGKGNVTLEVKYKDETLNRTGENALIIGKSGTPITADSWSLVGTEIHQQTDPKKRMIGAGEDVDGYSPGSSLNQRDEKKIPAQVDPVLSRNVFLKNYKVKNDDDEDIKLSEFQGDDVKFKELFSPLFNEMGLTIDNVDFFSNTVQIKDSKGDELARLSTNDKNSGDMIINFLKGYLQNVDGGILKELLSQGVIPKIAKGKTKPKADETDENKPDQTLGKTKEDCPGTWDDIMQTCG